MPNLAIHQTLRIQPRNAGKVPVGSMAAWRVALVIPWLYYVGL